MVISPDWEPGLHGRRRRYPIHQRALLAPFGILMGLGFATLAIVGIVFAGLPDLAEIPGVLLFLGMSTLFLWQAIEILRAQIEVSDTHLVKRPWLGTRQAIAWVDVVKLEWGHLSGYVLRSSLGETIRVSAALGGPEFPGILRARLNATQAAGFPTPDLSAPVGPQHAPKRLNFTIGVLTLAGIASFVDWREADPRCAGTMTFNVLIAYYQAPRTCTQLAIEKSDEAWLRRLLENGADPDRADRSGITPLKRAVDTGNFDAVKVLLDFGADPFRPVRFWMSPAGNAIHSGEIAIAREMVASRIDSIDRKIAVRLLTAANEAGQREFALELRTSLKHRLPPSADPEIEIQYFELLNAANNAFEAHNPGAASGFAEEAIKLDPTIGPAYVAAGFAYRQLRSYAKAKSRLIKALEIDEANAPAWGILAAVYLETGDYAEADRAATVSLELEPEDPHILADRAIARFELGRRADAIEDAKLACSSGAELACLFLEDLGEAPKPE